MTVACVGDALERHAGGLGKLHREATGAEVAPELLAEQNLHIGLIINHENKQVQVLVLLIWRWLRPAAAERS